MKDVKAMQQAILPPLSQGRPREDKDRDLQALQSMIMRNVSHEFRTPLGIILGYAELLSDGAMGALDQDQEHALSILIEHALDLRKVVDRISVLLAVEANATALMPLNLAKLAGRVVDDKRGDAGLSEIELAVRSEPDLPLVAGDVYQLEHAIESLIENALKFTPCGGKVVVRVSAESGWVHLDVSDTGIGIPEQELEHIFAGFYQVDGSPARKYGGLGLGLTLIKAVAKAHGGWVEVESQVEQGSRFLVKLPAFGTTAGRINRAPEWQH